MDNLEAAKRAQAAKELETQLEAIAKYAVAMIEADRDYQKGTTKKPQFTKIFKKLTIELHDKLFPTP